MNKKILHLIVGFGIYEYFVNSINSVLKYDKSSDLLILTTGNPKLFGWRSGLSSFCFDYEHDEISKVENFIKSYGKRLLLCIYTLQCYFIFR